MTSNSQSNGPIRRSPGVGTSFRLWSWGAWVLPLLLLAQGNAPQMSRWDVNRSRIESLSELELDALKRKKQRFDNMPENKQERLRTLHDHIEVRDDRSELIDIMLRYNEWLKDLDEKRRSQVRQLKGDDRIEQIRIIRREQAEEYFGRVGTQLPSEDVGKLFEWIEGFLEKNRERIIQQMDERNPRDASRGSRFRSRGNRGMRNLLVYFLMLARLNNEDVLIKSEDIELLRKNLSEEAVKIIDSQPSEQDKQQLVASWIVTALQATRDQISDRELWEFYRSNMTDEQRERVDQMTPERRRAEIRRRYINRNRERYMSRFLIDPRSSRSQEDSPRDRGGNEIRRPKSPTGKDGEKKSDGSRS